MNLPYCRRIAVLVATVCLLMSSTGGAAPVFTKAGDATFRNISATGGALSGVDLTSALVQTNGASTTISSIAAQASNAVPMTMAGQPNGWLKLDPTGLVPLASLPSTVANPVDATARASAAAAAAVAAAALPASFAGRPGGYAPLDGNALIPTANLPAAYTAASALPASTLGQANGPAVLDANASLSGNTVASSSSALQRSLASHFADTVDAADYGVKCNDQVLGDVVVTQGSTALSSNSYKFTAADVGDVILGGYQNGPISTTITSVNTATGVAQMAVASPVTNPAGTGTLEVWTDNTSALRAAVAVATSRTGGAELVIPAGRCVLSGEIDVADSTSLRIRGSGNQATNLVWTSQTNGLIVTESNVASLTIDDFMMSKRLGTNGSTTFIGTALSVGGAENQTGENKISDITIIGSTPAGQVDGWNQGLVETNLAHSFTSHVTVLQPGSPLPASYPTPGSSVSSLTASPFGQAADIVLQGSGSSSWYIDGALDGLTTTGGNVSLDLNAVQGVYITNSKFTYANYGVRADSNGTTSELLSLSNSYVLATVIDVYDVGVGNDQITGNLFWPGFNGPTTWAGVWTRDTGSEEITGNAILGHGGSSTINDYGIYISWDNGGGFPHTVSANTIYAVHGTALSNAAQTGGITATGNTVVDATYATYDPTYANAPGTGNATPPAIAGMGNLYFGNILNGLTAMSDDGNRNIQFAKNLTCGNFYDSCTFKVIGSNNTQAFSVDPSGNALATLSLKAPSVTTGTNNSHHTFITDLGLFSSGTATLTTDANALSTTNLLPGMPSVTTNGSLALYGDVSCQNSATLVETFHFSGIWIASTSGVLTVKSFAPAEADGQSAPPSGWGMQAAVDQTGLHPLLQMTGLPATTDCSAHVSETFVQ